MTFTTEHLTKLQEALLTGASSISVEGRTITFRSQSELLALIEQVQKALNTPTTSPNKITATYNK